MSKDLAFRKHLHCFLGTNANALTSKTIFSMCCRSFSIYLVMKKPSMGKTFKNQIKSSIPMIKILRNLLGLFKPKDSNLNRAKKAGVKSAFLEQDLVAIILLRK